MRFGAVAFDLDGTLYPDFSLFIRLVPSFFKWQRLLRAMGRARSHLRESGAYGGDFYELQARIMAEILGGEAEKVREKTDQLIYRGWEPLFRKIEPFPYVRETLDAFRREGISMGILSDFPPEKKLEHMKISGYWDTVVCSEETGRLKPDPLPFLELARRMGKNPEEILYVGNSVSYDVGGARRAGMKTALIRSRRKKRPAAAIPDFVFYDYRQLRDFVLN